MFNDVENAIHADPLNQKYYSLVKIYARTDHIVHH